MILNPLPLQQSETGTRSNKRHKTPKVEWKNENIFRVSIKPHGVTGYEPNYFYFIFLSTFRCLCRLLLREHSLRGALCWEYY